jgi:hypothetical protein
MTIDRPNQSGMELALRKYFTEPPPEPTTTAAVLFMALGLGLAALGALLHFSTDNPDSSANLTVFMMVLGLVAAGAGFLWKSSASTAHEAELAKLQPTPADRQVDQWLQEGIEKLCLHSRLALNLTEQEASLTKPLIITAPILNTTHGIQDEEIAWRKSSDNKTRFSVYKVAIIHLTERHLGAFVCDFNFIKDVALNETTQEYHYCDVVSVSTIEESQSYTLPTQEKLATKKIFSISVASGEKIQVPVEVERICKMTGMEKAPETGADSAVSTIRTMLRDKKS